MKSKASRATPTKPTSNKTDAAESEPNVSVVRAGSCKSLSGGSTIGFDIGSDAAAESFLRIRTNSGAGRFSREWFPLKAMQQALERAGGPVTQATLLPLCRGRSVNTAGFLLAALRHEGAVRPLPGKRRGYERAGPVKSMSEGRPPAHAPAAARKPADAARPLKAKAPARAKRR